MSIQLKPDEALEALQAVDPDLARHFEKILCSAVDAMAQRLAAHFECEAGEATMQGVAFAGICVPMFPAWQGQACPELFAEYDNATEWENDDAELPASREDWLAQRETV